MSALLNPAAGPLKMTSQEIAELTGKDHDNVRRDVKKLAEDLSLSFEEKVQASTGGRPSKVYLLPKRETLILVSGYSVQMRAAIIDRWQQLEAEPRSLSPANLSRLELIQLAMQAEQERLKLEQDLAVAAPKAQALDRIATGTDGSFCLTDAGKALQVAPRAFTAKLQAIGWIHRRPMGSGWLAYQDKIVQGLLEHKVTTGEKSDGHEWTSTQVRVTAKGMAKLAVVFERCSVEA